GDHTYAKVRFDDNSLETVRARLSELHGGAEEELSRAVIWTALWNMTRDGQWAANEFIDTVLQHAPHEDNTNLMATNFAKAPYAVAHLLSDDRREAKRAEFDDKFCALLQVTEPVSEAQLTIARSTIAALASIQDAYGTSRLIDMLQEGIRGLL